MPSFPSGPPGEGPRRVERLPDGTLLRQFPGIFSPVSALLVAGRERGVGTQRRPASSANSPKSRPRGSLLRSTPRPAGDRFAKRRNAHVPFENFGRDARRGGWAARRKPRCQVSAARCTRSLLRVRVSTPAANAGAGISGAAVRQPRPSGIPSAGTPGYPPAPRGWSGSTRPTWARPAGPQ